MFLRLTPLIGVLLVSSCIPQGYHPQTPSEIVRQRESSSWATLAVRNTRSQLPDGALPLEINVLVDGERVGTCNVQNVPGDLCVEEESIEPGAHTLEVWVRCRNPRTLAPWDEYSVTTDELVVRPRERLVLDVQRAFERAQDESYWLSRTRGGTADLSPCFAALEALAFAPSCTVAHVRVARGIAERARLECSQEDFSSMETRSWARQLLAQAMAAHLAQPIDRCFMRTYLSGRAPGLAPAMLPYGASRDFWPAESLNVGSWMWARDVLSRRPSEDTSPEALLDLLVTALPRVVPRLGVFYEVARAQIDQANVAPLVRRAMSQPWSFDPRGVNGHRNWYIVHGRMLDESYERRLAANAATDGLFRCGYGSTTIAVVRYFLEDDRLEADEWHALSAMMERTDPTEQLGRCTDAFDPSLVSDVPMLDRLRWFGQFDCSTRRHEAHRGTELERITRASNGIDLEVRQRIYQEFAACIPFPGIDR